MIWKKNRDGSCSAVDEDGNRFCLSPCKNFFRAETRDGLRGVGHSVDDALNNACRHSPSQRHEVVSTIDLWLTKMGERRLNELVTEAKRRFLAEAALKEKEYLVLSSGRNVCE